MSRAAYSNRLDTSPGALRAYHRLDGPWTQQEVADYLKCHVKTVKRLEQPDAPPIGSLEPSHLAGLYDLFLGLVDSFDLFNIEK